MSRRPASTYGLPEARGTRIIDKNGWAQAEREQPPAKWTGL